MILSAVTADERDRAIEQGKYSPSLETAFRIAEVFGEPVDQVFSGPE